MLTIYMVMFYMVMFYVNLRSILLFRLTHELVNFTTSQVILYYSLRTV